MQLGVSEILEQADAIDDEFQKIVYLRQNASKPILMVLQYALDPNIKWLLPPGMPAIVENKVPDGIDTMLLSEARRMYLFVEGGLPDLKPEKREVLFIQFLEMLSKKDIDLIANVKEKKLPYDSLTYDLVKKAFPNLLPDTDTIQVELSNGKQLLLTKEPVKTKTRKLKKPPITEVNEIVAENITDAGTTVDLIGEQEKAMEKVFQKAKAETVIEETHPPEVKGKGTKVTKLPKEKKPTIKDVEKEMRSTVKKGAKKS